MLARGEHEDARTRCDNFLCTLKKASYFFVSPCRLSFLLVPSSFLHSQCANPDLAIVFFCFAQKQSRIFPDLVMLNTVSVLSAPIIGIFGGAGPPVFRAMMSKIVSADDQGRNHEVNKLTSCVVSS